jgi:hypothetical protein
MHRPVLSRKPLVSEKDTLRVILYPRRGRVYPVEGEPDYYRVEEAALLGDNTRQPRRATSNTTATRSTSSHGDPCSCWRASKQSVVGLLISVKLGGRPRFSVP